MIRRLNVILRTFLAAVMVLGVVSVTPAAAVEGGLQWERSSSPGGMPFDVAVDVDGSYYVACVESATIEKFDSAGAHQWTFDVMGNFENYAANVDLDNTGVYVSVSGGTVAKLDKSDGSLVWEASGIPGGLRVIADIAAYDGTVYVTQPGAIGSFFTLNATTGAYISPFPSVLPDSEASYYGVAADAGGVYVVTNEYAVRKYAFDGTMIWGTTENRDTGGAPSLSADGAYLYVPSDTTNEVYKLSTVDGSILAVLGGQDGCNGVDVDGSGMLLTVLPHSNLVRAYTEPWPEFVEPPINQTIDNGIVKFTVQPEARPEAYVWGWDPDDEEDTWVRQYYGDDAWGTTVFLDGYGYDSGYIGGDEVFTPVSNEVVDISGGQQIVTVVDLGTSGVQMTQTVTLMEGDRFVTKTWSLANNGENSYEDVRLYHGGDTYFGGEDSAYGFYDPAKSMVYVRNEDFDNWGIMGFYANPATPAQHYFEGNYSDGTDFVAGMEDLSDSVLDEFEDAGYYLQWGKAGGMAAGAQWSIQAYEVWTPGGPIQLLAPGPQNVLKNTTVTLPFTLQNLSEVPQSITLTAETDQGWTATVLGDTTPDLNGVTSMQVLVEVEVPVGATDSANVTLSATGSETDVSASTQLSVSELALSVDPATLDLAAVVGDTDTKSVTVTNNGDAAVVLGAGQVDSEFSTAFTGTTLEPGGSVDVDVTFEPSSDGPFTGTLSVPVLSPELSTLTVSLNGETVVEPVPVEFDDVSGATRYSTAIEVSEASFPEGADAVVIATGENYPDALSGSALAGVLDAPVLLTRRHTLLPEVAADIQRLGAERVYVLGRESALSSGVLDALEDMLGAENVTRIGGADRYETAELVAARVVAAQSGAFDGTAFVATGEDFADALAAAPLAAANGWPVYLAPSASIKQSTVDAMEDAGVTKVILLGGEAVMAEGTEVGTLGAGLVVERIAGADRYDTAAQVARYGVSEAGMSWASVALVTGEAFPDALAGGAAQGRLGSVMLLTRRNSLPAASESALKDNADEITTARFYGSLSAVSQAVRDQVMSLF